jgi:peptide deformylase
VVYVAKSLYPRAAPNNITAMTLLKIARMGHPVLRQRAEEIPDPTAREIRILVRDMIETMDDAGGTGLAAPQVHVGRRLVIFEAPRERTRDAESSDADTPDDAKTIGLTTLINPEYEPLTDEMVLGWEGCLSVPGLTGAVPRYTHIRYAGFNLDGSRIEREAKGFHARVVQHETDHLDGLLYTMRMTDLKLLAFSEELKHFMRADDPDQTEETP